MIAVDTNLLVQDPPTPPGRALDQVDAWLEAPGLRLLSESPVHWQVLRAMSGLTTRNPLLG